MLHLILKEIRDFWDNVFGITSLAILLVVTFLILWIFPDSGYLSYGLAEGDLYFQFMSYLLLFIVPAFAVGFLASEYRYGTEELLRAMGINWRQVLLAKFIGAFFILLFVLLLTSVHLFVVYDLTLTDSSIPVAQLIGSYIGLIGVGACYICLALMITSFIEQTTASYIITVFVCFMLYSGLSLIGQIPAFAGGVDFWMDRISLSYHTDQIARGILRLSTVFYMVSLCIWSLWLAALRLNTKEI